MYDWYLKACLTLAQAAPWDDPPEAPTTEAAPRMDFSDLQKALHAANTGETDKTFRNGLFIMVGAVALLGLILHLREKHKHAGPPDSKGRLGWELSRLMPFPFGTRMLLWWVARSTATPLAALMISSQLFDHAVAEWERQPTFTLARRWGKVRLEALKTVLFIGVAD